MKASLGCLARLSAVLVLLGSIAAIPAAASVSITNFSFETVNTTYGCTTGSSLNSGSFIATVNLGSSCFGADPFNATWAISPSGNLGVWYPTAPFYSGAPDGTNVAFVNDGNISQILSSSAGLGTYTLSLFIGGRCAVNSAPINNYRVELFAGSASVASDPGNLVSSLTGSKCGTFLLDTLTGNVTMSSLVGQPLKIVLSATGTGPSLESSQAAFDDVTLNFQPAGNTPEPGTLILFGTGLLGLVHRLRRKRFAQS